MSQDRPASGFPAYLKDAIDDAGFPTPTHFARKAKVDPSVVGRWLSGDMRPTIRLLERIAPVLDKDINELVSEAYPEAVRAKTAPPKTARRKLHHLADEVDQQLDPSSPLSDEERQRVVIVVEAAVAPGREKMRKARRRRAS